MNRLTLGVFLVILSAAGFGVMPILARYAYAGGATVTTTLFVRFALAAFLFLLYLFGKRQHSLKLSGKQWLLLFLLGGVFYAATSAFYFSSVQYIPAPLAALLLYTYPIFVTILSVVIDKETLSKQVLGAVGLSVIGLMLVLGTSFASGNLFGVGLALLSAVGYSSYIVLGNRVVKSLPPVVTTTFVAFFTAVTLLLSSFFTHSISFHIAPVSWLAIGTLAIFSTIVAISAFFGGLKLIGSTKASVLSTFEPLVTAILSAVLFADHMTWLQMVGGAIVLFGAMLVVAAKDKSRSLSDNEQARV